MFNLRAQFAADAVQPAQHILQNFRFYSLRQADAAARDAGQHSRSDCARENQQARRSEQRQSDGRHNLRPEIERQPPESRRESRNHCEVPEEEYSRHR